MVIHIASDGPDITARVAASRKAARYLIGYDTERGSFVVSAVTDLSADLPILTRETLIAEFARSTPVSLNSRLSVAEVIDIVKQRELGEVLAHA